MTSHFKFKFYEHKYEDCRLIDIVDNIISFPFYNHNGGLKLSHSLSSSSISGLMMGSNSGISTPTSCGLGYSQNFIQKQSMIDLFCVASHYSTRFANADSFIEKICKDRNVKEHAFYLKQITDDNILTRFITSTMEPCKGVHITWKNMLYLWKIFIEEEKLPNVFFTNVLKKNLMKHLEYTNELVSNTLIIENSGDATHDIHNIHNINNTSDTHNSLELHDTQEMFLNMTSKHLPIVSKFMSFWGENITCNHNEIELEIDELSTLFINFGNVYHGNQKNTQTITDQTILGFIRHFLPDICIEEDKYLIHIGCKLWDKKQDILSGIEEFKKVNVDGGVGGGGLSSHGIILGKGKHSKSKDVITPLITTISQSSLNNISSISYPIHAIYEYYSKLGYKQNKMVVSKRYFEKFVMDNYRDYLTEKNGTLWLNF